MSSYFDQKELFVGPQVNQYESYDNDRCKKRKKQNM